MNASRAWSELRSDGGTTVPTWARPRPPLVRAPPHGRTGAFPGSVTHEGIRTSPPCQTSFGFRGSRFSLSRSSLGIDPPRRTPSAAPRGHQGDVVLLFTAAEILNDFEDGCHEGRRLDVAMAAQRLQEARLAELDPLVARRLGDAVAVQQERVTGRENRLRHRAVPRLEGPQDGGRGCQALDAAVRPQQD